MSRYDGGGYANTYYSANGGDYVDEAGVKVDGYDQNGVAVDPNAGGMQFYYNEQGQIVDEQGNVYAMDNSGNPLGATEYYETYDERGNPIQEMTTIPQFQPEPLVVPGVAGPEYDIYADDGLRNHGFAYFARLAVTSALSLFFKIFFTIQLYTTYVIVLFGGINFLLGCHYRMLSPPKKDGNPTWQSMAFFCLFFTTSFVIVTFLCLINDLIRDFWAATRKDRKLFGIVQSKNHAPWGIYAILVMGTLVIPLFWALGIAASEGMSGVYFVQFFFWISQIITIWFVIIMYAWMYVRAILQKSRAYSRRYDTAESVQQTLRQGDAVNVLMHHPQQKELSWYRNEGVLVEYGLDYSSLLWMIFIFVVCLIPLFIIIVQVSVDGQFTSWTPQWTAVGVIFFCIMAILREFLTSKHKERTAVGAMLLILVYFVLGLIGCGTSGNGTLFGVFIVLFAACQGMLLRKRQRTLSPVERAKIVDVPLVPQAEGGSIDSYLCCCKHTTFQCLGQPEMLAPLQHPIVSAAEKELRRKRVSLWTDQKVLFWYWVLLIVIEILLMQFSKSLFDMHSSSVATRTGDAIPAQEPTNPICSMTFNPTGSKLKFTDIALFIALAKSYGKNFDQDYGEWFSSYPDITRVYPVNVPCCSDTANQNANARWYDFQDSKSNFHIIMVIDFDRGTQFMRSLDMWGESFVLQLVSIFAPWVGAWPEHSKSDFVAGLAFYKEMLGGVDYTTQLENYIQNLQSQGHTFVITGHGFGGGIAKVVGRKLGIQSVALSPPGTAYLTKRLNLGENNANTISFTADRNIVSYVDKLEDGTVYYFQCPPSLSGHQCYKTSNVVNLILQSCGDSKGRGISGATNFL